MAAAGIPYQNCKIEEIPGHYSATQSTGGTTDDKKYSAAYPEVSSYNLRRLISNTETAQDCIRWLRDIGLLATKKHCPQCATLMRQINDTRRKDGVRWRCPIKVCRKECSIREESFFGGNSKLELKVMIDIVYHYAYYGTSFKNMMRECSLSSEALVNWRKYIRDLFAEYFIQNPVQIGGPGHIVEIDEAAFIKYNVGRVVYQTQWVFGGIDVKRKEGFMVAVEPRDAYTLLSILQTYVLPGTTVMSDIWGAYNIVANPVYQYLTVNQNIKFVDPTTGATTTNHLLVESMWCTAKQRNKKECGTHHTQESYMIEFMWRMKFGNDPFANLISCIRELYPV